MPSASCKSRPARSRKPRHPAAPPPSSGARAARRGRRSYLRRGGRRLLGKRLRSDGARTIKGDGSRQISLPEYFDFHFVRAMLRLKTSSGNPRDNASEDVPARSRFRSRFFAKGGLNLPHLYTRAVWHNQPQQRSTYFRLRIKTDSYVDAEFR